MARKKGYSFGTAPVFLTAISTILGAILFLRFGYAVANVGLIGAVLIILLGHTVTIPTGLAVSEIASNLKVEGGGEYFIISRTFGIRLGATIGTTLYLSEVISVAFYLIAFAEAFRPLSGWLQQQFGIIFDPRMVSLPAALILILLILRKGANLGVTALWGVASVLGISLLFFLLGKPTPAAAHASLPLNAHIANADDFFRVFSIVFPAFTGITAGVGLSGDLKEPGKSIPRGTLTAAFTGFLIYFLVVVKLHYSATPQEMAGDQLIMQRIALWGPIIPIGLAAATLSSAIGSVMVAPRTLQALARDRVFPLKFINQFFSRGHGRKNEPKNAALFSSLIILFFVAIGSVDMVARIITMFFLITYGSLCFASFLEHFAANPSYRPVFRSRWYLSLLGGIMSIIIMFQLSSLYAALALITLIVLYWSLRYSPEHRNDVGSIFNGALFQIVRWLRLLLQKDATESDAREWWPSVLAISRHTMERNSPFDLLRWISHRFGFGTYIHYLEGTLSPRNQEAAEAVRQQLLQQTTQTRAHVFLETIIAPTFTSAVANIIQVPGVSGLDNNTLLLEFKQNKPSELEDVLIGCRYGTAYNMNICVLRASDFRFGYHNNIHIWLEKPYYRSGNLMILLSYIIKGHPDWQNAHISLFAPVPRKDLQKESAYLQRMIQEGRLPISRKNVKALPYTDETTYQKMVMEHSAEADLVMFGFDTKELTDDDRSALTRYPKLRDVLFVCANQKILIS